MPYAWRKKLILPILYPYIVDYHTDKTPALNRSAAEAGILEDVGADALVICVAMASTTFVLQCMVYDLLFSLIKRTKKVSNIEKI